MTRGTKSLLFGAHQFLIHPIMVTISWWVLFGRLPTWREAICIVIHDVGYLGCQTMDGEDGTEHPRRGAELAGRWFGAEFEALVAGHSRHFAKVHGYDSLSPLFAADKLAVGLTPALLYLPGAILSGEVAEYIPGHKESRGRFGAGRTLRDKIAWFRWVRGVMRRQAFEYMTGRARDVVQRTEQRGAA